MEANLEIVYRAANTHQAAILKNILTDEGIDAVVTNIALQGIIGEVPLGWNSSPCVLVRREDLAAAREIAEQFDRDASSRRMATDQGSDESEDDGEDEAFADDEPDVEDRECSWPPCPDCQRTRRGRCPECGGFDSWFPPAEYLVENRQQHADGPVATESFEVVSPDDLFMCTLCERAVVPEPQRYCPGCGHDFGDGIEIEPRLASSWNQRTTLVVAALAVGALAVAYYFWQLMR